MQWLQEKGNLDKVIEIRKQFNQELNNRGDVTDKQAMSASLILTADKLIEALFFNDGICLTVDDIKPFLVTKNDVDQNKRCYEFLNDYVVANYNRFNEAKTGGYIGDVFGDARSDRTYFIKSKFDVILTENGYSPRAFLSWASKNGLLASSGGRNTITHRIPGIEKTCNCVCLLSQELEEAEEDGDLPF